MLLALGAALAALCLAPSPAGCHCGRCGGPAAAIARGVLRRLVQGHDPCRSSARAGLLAIRSAQVLYRDGYRDGPAHGRPAASLAALGAASLIDRSLAAGVKGTYRFRLLTGPEPRRWWWAVAEPTVPCADHEVFCLDADGTVWVGPRALTPFVPPRPGAGPPGFRPLGR